METISEAFEHFNEYTRAVPHYWHFLMSSLGWYPQQRHRKCLLTFLNVVTRFVSLVMALEMFISIPQHHC
jgi:hypothetical protein